MFVILSARCRTARHELGAITPASIEAISGDEAVTLLQQLAVTRRVLDGVIAEVTARIEATAAARTRGDRNTAETCSKALRTSAHAGQVMANAARSLVHRLVREALVSGAITTDAAALIGQTLQHAPDATAELLAAAELGPTELTTACIKARAAVEDPTKRRRRQHASRSLHTWNDADGMYCGKFRLTPEIGGQFDAVIQDGIRRHFRAHRSSGDHEPHAAYAADTLAELVLEHSATTDTSSDPTVTPTESPDDNVNDNTTVDDAADAPATEPDDDRVGSRVRVNVHVLIDHAALVRGFPLPGETCEIPGVGPVNVDWVRGLLGEALLTAIIRDGTDIRTVAHFGRHVNAKLRTALLVEGRECDVVDCHRRGYLEIDHIHDHAKRGPTALHNLHFLCSHHHRQKTQGWVLGPPDPLTRKRTLLPPPRARAPDRAA